MSWERCRRFGVFETLIFVKGVDRSVQALMLAHLMVSPALGSNAVDSRLLGLCNKLGRDAGPLNQRTQDWETDANAAEINSGSWLCHGPEDGDGDQPLVGEGGTAIFGVR